MTSRVLLTGGAGLLGRHLVRSAPDGVELHLTWRSSRPPGASAAAHCVELSDPSAVHGLCEQIEPDLVVHTAYDPADLEGGVVEASANVAAGCAEVGAALIHLSSDVVFDGEHAPYDEHAALCPVSAYGAAKARAETEVVERVQDAALIRTSLLCDADPPDPRSAWVLGAMATGEPITLFDDEVRQPARADDLAARIWALRDMHRSQRAGPWHLVGPEALTRHEIGRRLAAATGQDPGPLRVARSIDQSTPRPRDLRLAVTREGTPTGPNRPFDGAFAPVDDVEDGIR